MQAVQGILAGVGGDEQAIAQQVAPLLGGLQGELGHFIGGPILGIAHPDPQAVQLAQGHGLGLFAQPLVVFQPDLVHLHHLLHQLGHPLVDLLGAVVLGVQLADGPLKEAVGGGIGHFAQVGAVFHAAHLADVGVGQVQKALVQQGGGAPHRLADQQGLDLFQVVLGVELVELGQGVGLHHQKDFGPCRQGFGQYLGHGQVGRQGLQLLQGVQVIDLLQVVLLLLDAAAVDGAGQFRLQGEHIVHVPGRFLLGIAAQRQRLLHHLGQGLLHAQAVVGGLLVFIGVPQAQGGQAYPHHILGAVHQVGGHPPAHQRRQLRLLGDVGAQLLQGGDGLDLLQIGQHRLNPQLVAGVHVHVLLVENLGLAHIVVLGQLPLQQGNDLIQHLVLPLGEPGNHGLALVQLGLKHPVLVDVQVEILPGIGGGILGHQAADGGIDPLGRGGLGRAAQRAGNQHRRRQQ